MAPEVILDHLATEDHLEKEGPLVHQEVLVPLDLKVVEESVVTVVRLELLDQQENLELLAVQGLMVHLVHLDPLESLECQDQLDQ